MFFKKYCITIFILWIWKTTKTFSGSEKFWAGCQALGGRRVCEISEEFGMSRTYVYQLKDAVAQLAHSFDYDQITKGPVVVLDNSTVEKLVLCMAMHGNSPYEGIRQTLKLSLGYDISIGRISSIIKEAAKRAQVFDDQVDISGITQGANDEIFQGQIPILTGVGPVSTYTYLLAEADDRKAETWELHMSEANDKGLKLKVNISDQAKGLTKGVKAAFPESDYQPDVFHVIYDIGKEVSKIERKAYAAIRREYELKGYLESKRISQKHKDEYKEHIPKTCELIKLYDTVHILFTWFRELLGFSGYSKKDSFELMEYIISELKVITKDYPKFQKELDSAAKILPDLLSFIERLYKAFENESKSLNIPFEAFLLMYRQKTYNPCSVQSNDIEYQLVIILMSKYEKTRASFNSILENTKKASSMVENINGRIRVYTDVKRTLKGGFFALMKVFLNTEPYTRSRIAGRKGKSPLELMTGKPQPRFLETLGY